MDNKKHLKIALNDIIRGYSILTHNDKNLYLKHLTHFDVSFIDEENEKSFNKAIEKGIPTNEDRLKYLEKEGLWGAENEKRISYLKDEIANNELSLTKLIIKRDTDALKKIKSNNEKELRAMEIEKSNLIGNTAEIYANKRVSDYSLYVSLYKDAALTERYYSTLSFDDLDEEELAALGQEYMKKVSVFGASNIKKIALLPNFLNMFYLCRDKVTEFYGRAIIYLSFYQIELFSNGIYFKNVLQECGGSISPEMFSDPDKLIEMVNTSKNTKELMDKLDKNDVASPNNVSTGATSIVGMTRDDQKRLGLEGQSLNLAKEMKKLGKTSLSMQDLINIHGD